MAEVNVEVGVSAFPARDARFPARLRGDRACPSAANVAVSSRRFAPAHLSRPLRSDTRSPRRRRTPRRARSPWTCRTPRRSRSRWWTPRCSRRSRSCAMSARKPRRPARRRYDSSRDRDTAAMVFLSALASTWATSPAVSVPTRRDATARRGERAMRPNRPAFKTPRRFRRDARVPGARARAARRADPQPQISVASTRAVPSRRVRFGATRHLRSLSSREDSFFCREQTRRVVRRRAVLLPPSTRDA